MRQNILGTFALTLFGISIAAAASPPLQYNDEGAFQVFSDKKITLQYSVDGVLRQDENASCNIMFVNLGGNSTICNLSKKFYKKSDVFNITLTNLNNGNLGLNNDTQFDSAVELPKYIDITQNGVKFPNTEFTFYNDTTGKFSLLLYNLTSCDGLKIQQNFKDELVTVANRLYYVNVVPDSINHAFDSKLFGPSYDFPFKRIHWKMNEGLEDLRKTCGIHMLYKNFDRNNKYHWQYYLSSESINTKNCTVYDFFDIIKRNYIDFQYTTDLLGDNYMGYVFKREGHVEVHMDGVIVNDKYLVEIYQNKCNDLSEAKTTCTIRSDDQLSFLDFTDRMVHDCLYKTMDENETIDWTIKNSKATGILNNQKIEIELFKKDKKGSLPTYVDGDIGYTSSTTANATKLARFVVTLSCGDGTFSNEECQCQACAKHCAKCNNAFTCLECEEDERVFFDEDYSICVIKKGFFEDPVENEIEACKKECSECVNFNSCTVCKDPKAIMSDGNCICPNSYMKDDGYCAECEEGCGRCNKDGCLICLDESKNPSEGCN